MKLDREAYNFDLYIEDERILACIHSYLRINGVIEIKKLLEIIEKYHNIDVNRKQLLKYVGEMKDLIIHDNYINVSGLDSDIVKEIFSYKKIVNEYKIIDEDFNEFNYQLNVVEDRIIRVCKRYAPNIYIVPNIRSIMYLSGITYDNLTMILYGNNVFLSNNMQKNCLKI